MANRRFIDFPIASTVNDNDIVLIWQDGLNKQTTKGTLIQGAPTSLEGLTDVDIAGLINGQILQYNSTTGKWENVDRTDINLSQLGDVSIVSPTNGQVLVYNSTTSKWENSSGGYVPYVGAVTTVDLGAQGLIAGYIRFNTSVVSVPNEQGLMYWDGSKSTVALIMNGTIQHIGQDTYFYVKNSSGSNIAKGTAVRFDGTDGASGHLLIAPFLADGTYPSAYFMGVTSEAIDNGGFGQVTNFGEIEGIDTSIYSAGDLLYASTTSAGAFQTTAPVAPNNIVLIAAAVNSKNNGAIIVRPTYGSNINDDEGVKIVSPTTGDLLQLQAGGLWENKTKAQVLGGTSSQFVKGDGSLDSNTYGTGTVTSVGLYSATSGVTIGSTPVTTSGTITIAIATASGSQNGLLSSTDWTTFNNKQNALTNPVTGTGTTNYLPKFTGTSTIGNSQIFDNGTNVGIGTATPSYKLDIQSSTDASLFNITSTATANNSSLRIGIDGNNSFINASGGSTGILQFRTYGTTRATIDVSGNLGLGVTPSAWYSTIKAIQIGSTTSLYSTGGNTILGENIYVDASDNNKYLTNDYATQYRQVDGKHIWYNSASGTAGDTISFTQAMTLTSGGNLLVGTTTDAGYKLDVNGTGRFSSSVTATGDIRSNAIFRDYQGEALIQTSGSDTQIGSFGAGTPRTISLIAGNDRRLFITSGGNVLIGTTTDSGAKLNVNGSYKDFPVSIEAATGGNQLSLTRVGAVAEIYMGGSTAGTTALYVRSGGSGGVRLNSGSTGWVSASDIRLKDIEKPIENAVQSLSALQTVYYSWKDSEDKSLHLGLIAQEVEAVFPEIVSKSSIDEMKGVNYTELIPVLIKSIQELKQEINTLKNN